MDKGSGSGQLKGFWSGRGLPSGAPAKERHTSPVNEGMSSRWRRRLASSCEGDGRLLIRGGDGVGWLPGPLLKLHWNQ